jgi:hypothetical protein
MQQQAVVQQEEEPVREFDATKIGRSPFNVKWWWKKIKMRFIRHRLSLVNIELENGFHITLMVTEKDNGFKWKGKKYVFDEDLKYYNLSAKMWCYDYHENFTLPVKISQKMNYKEEVNLPIDGKIPVNEIKKLLEESKISEVEYMANPTVLQRYTISKMAEGIMKGQQIDAFFKQIRLLIIITAVASIIHLFLFAQKSGMLAQIKMPF